MPIRPPDAATRAAPPIALPTYALYGERGRTQANDWLHVETIRERSERHQWEIRPHRHETLFQILYIDGGAVEALLDGRTQRLAGPCVLTVPALVPHGFRFAHDVDGDVVTVLERHLAALLEGAGTLPARLMRAQALAWPRGDAAARRAARKVALLREEFFATGRWREQALDAALLALAVELGRLLPDTAAPAAAGGRALGHVRRFRELVEARFRGQPALSVLAREIGITPTHLNRSCHRVLGHSALSLLNGRLVLEAQRDLAYTTASVKQIALGLGFGDAGYFTRFFQRETGHTPTAWRASARR